MKLAKTLRWLSYVLMTFLMIPIVEGQIPDLYVNATTGNDQNTGSKEQPFKNTE